MVCEFPPVVLTVAMRETHVRLYREDWPSAELDRILREGIIPSTMILSILSGQMGEQDWFRIKVLKEYTAKFHAPFRIGDTMRARSEVTDLLDHRNPAKDYSYVTVQQDVFNQRDVLAYERTLKYAVTRRNHT